MTTEIEAKFIAIDPASLRQKLGELGAVLVHAERSMIRQIFDYPDKRLEKIGGWVRLRDEGDKITLSYKQLNDRTLHGTKEIEVIINDFFAGVDLLQSINLESKSVQETKREKWKMGEVEITIDTWPWIPAFMEIEGPTEEQVKKVAQQLDLAWSLALHGSVEVVYQYYYNVTEEEIWAWKEMRFGSVPEWLERKRIHT